MSDKYRRCEDYKREGKGFLVVVNHYTVFQSSEPACFDSEGPHRWAVYAYVYPSHPHFAAFDGTETMWQGAATQMPGNAYPSFMRVHTPHGKETPSSYQVGWDYHHLHDWSFSRMETPEDAYEVFRDADALFDWLAEKADMQGARDEL